MTTADLLEQWLGGLSGQVNDILYYEDAIAQILMDFPLLAGETRPANLDDNKIKDVIREVEELATYIGTHIDVIVAAKAMGTDLMSEIIYNLEGWDKSLALIAKHNPQSDYKAGALTKLFYEKSRDAGAFEDKGLSKEYKAVMDDGLMAAAARELLRVKDFNKMIEAVREDIRKTDVKKI